LPLISRIIIIHKNPRILSFNDIHVADLPLVGGKGANLGEMPHAGLPVLARFYLTTSAFQHIIAACPTAADHNALLDTVNDVPIISCSKLMC